MGQGWLNPKKGFSTYLAVSIFEGKVLKIVAYI